MCDQQSATVRPAIHIDDGLLCIHDYPREEGRLEILTTPDGGVLLNAHVDEEDSHAEAGITVDPDTAEAVAELLEDYAVMARAGVRANEVVVCDE